jgi:hypothetical protein
VLGRLSLSPADLADLLDWNLAVDIGVESGSRRVHRLFFSAPEEMCFVAIQDQANGAVVTVLPIDFHENISWQVSLAAQDSARNLACPGGAPESLLRRTGTVNAASTPGPSLFKLLAYVRRSTGSVKGVNLGSWPCGPYDGQVARLLEDDGFFDALDERLNAKGVQPGQLEALYVRPGKDGKATRISR